MVKLLEILFWPLLYLSRRNDFRYSNLFYHCEGIFKYYPREEMLKTALRFIKLSKIEGDYLEFGVYKGDTFSAAYHLAKRNELDVMHFFAFDSFEGLPELKGEDKDGTYQFLPGEYKCDLESFNKNLEKNKVDTKRVTLIPGWFSDSLNEINKKKYGIKKAALLWVDCDLYESTVPVLEFITPLLQDGSIIVFDDWYCFRGRSDMGEQKAFSEWLAKNPKIKAQEYHRFGWHGNSFIINFST